MKYTITNIHRGTKPANKNMIFAELRDGKNHVLMISTLDMITEALKAKLTLDNIH